ncbi:hypothetical protein K488DRAFT_88566 [Vararia minispora EC-137]|uniref:Uncharacterized protein n=1 Tax=Vararia minispora EC-137 TaxID=1314806 RepID=A0ACB8QD65_9AGAM|nr:hypothetical protein K488DRAFT_88566 [Vararia minispora EC-137]
MPTALSYDHHYAVLGVAPHASFDEIRNAYKRLALKWHPDRHVDDKEVAAVKFVEINKAYTALTETTPRKLRKPPPKTHQANTSPPSVLAHEASYVYLRHVDVPLDSPLQPLPKPPVPQGRKTPSDPGAPTQWTFPLEVSMHELYHGTSQKFHISTGDGTNHSVKVVVPAGTQPGAKVHALPTVVFEIRERPHAYLARVITRPHDLFMCIELPWSVDGEIPEGHIAFSGPGGEDIQVTLPRGLVEGTEGAVVEGKGMPKRKGDEIVGYGNLYIRWDFFTPEKSIPSRSKWDVFKKVTSLRS